MKKLLKRLYDWVLSWAESPYGTLALFILAFAESSFFPIPPDVLLIALAISKPKRSFYYGVICIAGSVTGGMFGYLLGWQLMETIGYPILNFYGITDKFQMISDLYHKYDAWAVGIAGFTIIPYKVFTITAGATKINFPVFLLASALGRGGRFMIVSALIFIFGARIKTYIDKYFDLLSIIFVILLILGFVVIKFIIGN